MPLSPDELGILRLLAQGLSSKAIAAKEGISRWKVERLANLAIHKSGAKNAVAAVARAIREKWID